MTSLAAAAAIGNRAGGAFAERLFGFVERSHARACAALLLLSLACFLPGFVSLQPMDRDEPRYAQATKQMLETGDFVDIRFQGEARHKKPVGIYWLQAASVAAGEALGVPEARTTIALYRIPSLIGAAAMVLLTYWAALAFAGRREAFLAAAFMAACVVLMVEARLAKTDAVLGACSVAAMGALARAWFARGAPALPLATVLTFWLAVALGVLVKGPLVPMFAGLTVLALFWRERSARWFLSLKPGLGIAIVLAVALPWFVAIAVKSQGAFFAESVGHDMLGKVGTAQTYHWAPPGFYVLAFFATFWPAAAFAVMAIPFAWASRHDDRIAFALAWIVPSWLVFEMVPTKLPHYVMPLYPAIAILTVMALARGFVAPRRLRERLAALLVPFIPAGLTVALAFAAKTLDGRLPWAGMAVLLLATLIAVEAWRRFVRDEPAASALLAVAAAPVLAIGAFTFTQPVMPSLRLSPRLAETARALDCPGRAVGTLGYREPSLVFLTGTDLRMLEGPRQAAEFLKAGTCRVAFVEGRFEEGFRREVAELGVRPALMTRLSGFNFNGGRRLDIGAFAVRP
ncbi:MAG TPA: glycosyltransferase family 39 protein [Beijerinckiaceae bacterium]|jgi:4-amino-4-deoxy-L-arabinose transferase-like glycosyltransferase